MGKVQPYHAFVTEFGRLAKDDFLARVSKPHLFFPKLPDLETIEAFTTIQITPGSLPTGAVGAFGQAGIVEITKDSANAFGMMITMGRAPNNDLIIPDKRVSKFHAYFRELGGKWSVTDANSTNGTKVDGEKVAPNTSRALVSGCSLELSGAIPVRFLEPSELYAHMRGTLPVR